MEEKFLGEKLKEIVDKHIVPKREKLKKVVEKISNADISVEKKDLKKIVTNLLLATGILANVPIITGCTANQDTGDNKSTVSSTYVVDDKEGFNVRGTASSGDIVIIESDPIKADDGNTYMKINGITDQKHDGYVKSADIIEYKAFKVAGEDGAKINNESAEQILDENGEGIYLNTGDTVYVNIEGSSIYKGKNQIECKPCIYLNNDGGYGEGYIATMLVEELKNEHLVSMGKVQKFTQVLESIEEQEIATITGDLVKCKSNLIKADDGDTYVKIEGITNEQVNGYVKDSEIVKYKAFKVFGENGAIINNESAEQILDENGKGIYLNTDDTVYIDMEGSSIYKGSSQIECKPCMYKSNDGSYKEGYIATMLVEELQNVDYIGKIQNNAQILESVKEQEVIETTEQVTTAESRTVISNSEDKPAYVIDLSDYSDPAAFRKFIEENKDDLKIKGLVLKLGSSKPYGSSGCFETTYLENQTINDEQLKQCHHYSANSSIENFEEFIKIAMENDLALGFYYYTTAINEAQASQEAAMMYTTLKHIEENTNYGDYSKKLPLAIDIETAYYDDINNNKEGRNNAILELVKLLGEGTSNKNCWCVNGVNPQKGYNIISKEKGILLYQDTSTINKKQFVNRNSLENEITNEGYTFGIWNTRDAQKKNQVTGYYEQFAKGKCFNSENYDEIFSPEKSLDMFVNDIHYKDDENISNGADIHQLNLDFKVDGVPMWLDLSITTENNIEEMISGQYTKANLAEEFKNAVQNEKNNPEISQTSNRTYDEDIDR